MIWRMAPYLAVLALAVAGWWHGYSTGRDAERLDNLRAIEALEHDLERVGAANRAAAALKKAGLAADIRKEESKGKALWSVTSRGDAAALSKVKGLGFPDAYFLKR